MPFRLKEEVKKSKVHCCVVSAGFFTSLCHLSFPYLHYVSQSFLHHKLLTGDTERGRAVFLSWPVFFSFLNLIFSIHGGVFLSCGVNVEVCPFNLPGRCLIAVTQCSRAQCAEVTEVTLCLLWSAPQAHPTLVWSCCLKLIPSFGALFCTLHVPDFAHGR